MHPAVELIGNSAYSQKGVASLSCRGELSCDMVYPARIESWRESHYDKNDDHNDNNNNNNNDNNI